MTLVYFMVMVSLLRTEVAVSFPPIALVGLPLFLVATVSSFLGSSFAHGFWGSGFELGTGASLSFFALAVFVGAAIPERFARLFPLAAIPLCILIVLFSIFGSHESAGPRPTTTQTFLIAAPVYGESLARALFGAGPLEFSRAWERYRDPDTNSKFSGDVSPQEGGSTASTVAVELGTLGFAALIFCFLPLVVALGTVPRRTLLHDGALLLNGVLAAIVLLSSFFFLLSLPVFLLGAAALGCVGQFVSQRSLRVALPRMLAVRAVVALIFLFVLSLITFVVVSETRAASEHARGLKKFASGDTAGAIESLSQAANEWKYPLYERDASRAALEGAFSSAPSGSGLGSPTSLTLLSKAEDFIDAAIRLDPQDYASWVARGSQYISLAAAGYDEDHSLANAEDSLQSARTLAPSRPEPLYLLAAVRVLKNQKNEALDYLKAALQRKADYAPALELKQKILTPQS